MGGLKAKIWGSPIDKEQKEGSAVPPDHMHKNRHMHVRTCLHTDTSTHSLRPRFVATAQLCCGRHEDCDGVRKASEAPTRRLLNGRVDIYPGWLWLLLRQKWFNLLCGIQRNLFWWMERAMAKDLEMSVGCMCILYLHLLTHCFWHECYLGHLEPMLTVIQNSTVHGWRGTENFHSMSVESPSQRLPSRFVESYIQAHNSSTMSISQPSASTPFRLTDQTWLNPTLVLTVMPLLVTHFSLFIFTVLEFCKTSASPDIQ